LQRDVRGAPRAILEINNDITERKRTEDELRLSEQRLSLAASVAKVGVWDWCLADNTLTWDATMFEIYGLAPVFPMAYEKWSTAVSAEDLPRVEAVLQKVIAEKSEGFAEFSITRADGAVRNLSAAEKVVLDDDAKVIRVIGVNMDITERKAADELNRIREEQLSHTAHHDFLTGLPNRMLLNDRVNRAIASASRNRKRIAVMFLDLDGFKQINDSLGHLFGDKLLQSIAKRLVDAVRMSDTVSRQGGDEFVELLSEVAHSEDCAITAQRMLQAVAEPHSIDQNELFVTTSIGIAVYPDHGRDAETLLKNADTAMYHAKENGRQSYHFFEPAIIARAEKRQFDSRPPPDAASF
jgi:diguanylate cyclase (GGDEF)-like protein/PAS domain S-box-containing protein